MRVGWVLAATQVTIAWACQAWVPPAWEPMPWATMVLWATMVMVNRIRRPPMGTTHLCPVKHSPIRRPAPTEQALRDPVLLRHRWARHRSITTCLGLQLTRALAITIQSAWVTHRTMPVRDTARTLPTITRTIKRPAICLSTPVRHTVVTMVRRWVARNTPAPCPVTCHPIRSVCEWPIIATTYPARPGPARVPTSPMDAALGLRAPMVIPTISPTLSWPNALVWRTPCPSCLCCRSSSISTWHAHPQTAWPLSNLASQRAQPNCLAMLTAHFLSDKTLDDKKC